MLATAQTERRLHSMATVTTNCSDVWRDLFEAMQTELDVIMKNQNQLNPFPEVRLIDRLLVHVNIIWYYYHYVMD